MNRTDRLHAVHETLRRRRSAAVTAAQLAEAMEVSVRTIKRDVSALQQAGAPIWAQPGPGGGYVLDASATLPPVAFTPSQVVSIAVALAALPPGSPFSVDAANAADKVLDPLGPSARARTEALAERVWVMTSDRADLASPAVRRAIERSLTERLALRIDGSPESRTSHVQSPTWAPRRPPRNPSPANNTTDQTRSPQPDTTTSTMHDRDRPYPELRPRSAVCWRPRIESRRRRRPRPALGPRSARPRRLLTSSVALATAGARGCRCGHEARQQHTTHVRLSPIARRRVRSWLEYPSCEAARPTRRRPDSGIDPTRLVRMGAVDPIELASRPASVESLVADLRALGVPSAGTVMVHSSLSRLGYVAGGAQAVVMALLEVVGREGTLVMPTHSGDLSDPAEWRNPPVPEAWWDEIRATMPAYDPRLTPTRAMGAIAECFRRIESARRSDHPTVSATAVGPSAEAITSGHELAYGLGESSPQARLYDLDGWVLLLGVSHANNTSLHLAEYRAEFPDKPWTTHSSPLFVDGQRQWVSYPDMEADSDDFEQLGEAFAVTGRESTGRVAAGTGRLCRVREVVDFGVRWMSAHRGEEV